MNLRLPAFRSLLAFFVFVAQSVAQQNTAPASTPRPDAERLQTIVDRAVTETLAQFAGKNLRTNQLAVTLIDLRRGQPPAQASYRGDAPIYPASVVKLFYLAAAHQWMEDGKLTDREELRRALRDMIVESSNDATHYVVDAVTGTTGGPELPPEEMKTWSHQRNAVNRYFASLGYTHLNVNQKPWCEGPYGRERVFVGQQYENRNRLTTDGTARLLAEIVQGRAVSPGRSAEMMKLLERDPAKKGDEQATDYTGAALPAGARLWSKAGWTSSVRHDAAYVELPAGGRFVLVTFTTGQSQNREIIPALARRVVTGME